jgi:hypothetical protein
MAALRLPRPLIAVGLVCGALACCVAWCWPESAPPETLPGSNAAFDLLLGVAGSGRRFVFDENERIVAARMDGVGDEVLLDLPRLTGVLGARSGREVALSPDRRRLAVVVLTGPGDNPDNCRLAVLDIPSGRAEQAKVPRPLADPADEARGRYKLENQQPLPHWLDGRSFVVSLIWYPPEGAHRYRLKFLKYEVDRLDRPEEVDLGLRWPYLRVGPGGVLMIGDGDEPNGGSNIPSARVLSANGLRPATEDERLAFKHILMHEYADDPCGPAAATVVRLSLDYFAMDQRGDREIRFGSRLVRRTGDYLNRKPQWNEELGLYLWEEMKRGRLDTFLADPAGRYRRWHHGQYAGSIPVRK